MEPTITSEAVVAYSQCTRKAYLWVFRSEQGEPHEYERILEEKLHSNRIAYFKKLGHKNLGVCGYDTQSMSNRNTVMVEASVIPSFYWQGIQMTPNNSLNSRCSWSISPYRCINVCSRSSGIFAMSSYHMHP